MIRRFSVITPEPEPIKRLSVVERSSKSTNTDPPHISGTNKTVANSTVKTVAAKSPEVNQRKVEDVVRDIVDKRFSQYANHSNIVAQQQPIFTTHYVPQYLPQQNIVQQRQEPPRPEPQPKEPSARNYDSDDDDMSCGHWCEYVIVVVLSSILLVASVVLVLFWCLYYRKGYAWNDNPTVQFNLHPTLMITGFIFFSGFSMLLYRISRCCRRIYVKLLHTLFHTLAIPCVVLGFMAVLDSHNLADPPIPNFYSIHSWLGFVTMGLFALQFVVGFFSFLLLLCCDSATAGFRASLVPVHATFGLTTFMLAIATCLTGLTEKAYFNFGADYSRYPEEGIIMNALAMVLVALGILVSYAVRREPLRVHSVSYVSERL